jgi:hypothetical protein
MDTESIFLSSFTQNANVVVLVSSISSIPVLDIIGRYPLQHCHLFIGLICLVIIQLQANSLNKESANVF